MLQHCKLIGGFLDVLRQTEGMYMLLGKSGQFLHWVGYDAFHGVLYPGKGKFLIIDDDDLLVDVNLMMIADCC